MSIRQISRKQFDAFNPVRAPMAMAVGDEQEWYQNDKKTVLGVLIRDKADDDWVYVVLAPEGSSTFHAVTMDASIPTREAAREKLDAAMREWAGRRKKR